MRKSLVLALLIVGCGSDQTGQQLLPGFDPGPVPQGGYQAISPPVRNIPPGANVEYCTWTDKIINDVVDIKSFQGVQSQPAGHHSILYLTQVHQPAGTTRECTDADMATFRFVG